MLKTSTSECVSSPGVALMGSIRVAIALMNGSRVQGQTLAKVESCLLHPPTPPPSVRIHNLHVGVCFAFATVLDCG